MKSFFRFITEMPFLSQHIIRTDNGLGRTLEQELGHAYKSAKKISSIHGHNLYQYDQPRMGTAFFLIDPKTKNIKAKIVGKNLIGDSKKFEIGYTQKHSQYPGKMKEIYKHLVIHHGLTLVSDTSHSPGSYNNYKDLADDPDLEVTRKSFSGDKLDMHRGRGFGTNYFDHTSQFYVRKKK